MAKTQPMADSRDMIVVHDMFPRIPWMIFSLIGPRAYVKCAVRLHTTDVATRPTAA
jgi:hypothetical protein